MPFTKESFSILMLPARFACRDAPSPFQQKHRGVQGLPTTYFLFLLFLLLASSEEFLPAAEVALKLDADALRGERRLCEVAIVGLIVGFERERTARRETIRDVEVADKVVAVHLVLVLTVAKIAVELQSAA